MAQHDFNIANAGGATVRADINNVLAAIQSSNSGTSAPSSTVAGMLWLDTSGGLPYALKIRDGGNNHWLTIGTVNDPGSDGNMSVGAIEGTAVLSTGESGGSKFLREDGDGSCSWQTVSGIPTGMIGPYANNSVPTGWLACDGSLVSRSTYADLFSAIGITWGAGDGSSTFALPDLEGAFLRGTGSHATQNMQDGNDYAGPSVGSFESDQNQQHLHNWAHGPGAGTANNYGAPSAASGHDPSDILTSVDASAGTALATAVQFQGGDEARPFNAGVKYCIKF